MEIQKKFRCKNEELIVISEYVVIALQRDLTDFTAYAPIFDQKYLDSFKSQIAAMRKIVFPLEMTKELKMTTANLYNSMNQLYDSLLRLEGYLKLAKKEIPMSATDFGIVPLKQKIRKRDAEGLLQNLQLLISNIGKYKEPLIKQGLSEASIDQFKKAFEQIDNGNNKQFEIVSSRRLLAAENMNTLNTLYAQLMEICGIGKILYRKFKPEKRSNYIFADLMKSVRLTVNKEDSIIE